MQKFGFRISSANFVSSTVIEFPTRGTRSNTRHVGKTKFEIRIGLRDRNPGLSLEDLSNELQPVNGGQPVNTCQEVLDVKGLVEKLVGTGRKTRILNV